MTTTKNNAHVIGNLTEDPTLRSTQQSRPVCNLTVATKEFRKKPDADGYDQFTEFHHCVAWGPVAEHIAGRLRKGDLVSIEGPLRTRPNKTEKATFYNTTIEVEAWDFLHRPQQAAGESAGAATDSPDATTAAGPA